MTISTCRSTVSTRWFSCKQPRKECLFHPLITETPNLDTCYLTLLQPVGVLYPLFLCFRLASWGVVSSISMFQVGQLGCCILYFYVLGWPVGVLYPLFLCFRLAGFGVVSSISYVLGWPVGVLYPLFLCFRLAGLGCCIILWVF